MFTLVAKWGDDGVVDASEQVSVNAYTMWWVRLVGRGCWCQWLRAVQRFDDVVGERCWPRLVVKSDVRQVEGECVGGRRVAEF